MLNFAWLHPPATGAKDSFDGWHLILDCFSKIGKLHKLTASILRVRCSLYKSFLFQRVDYTGNGGSGATTRRRDVLEGNIVAFPKDLHDEILGGREIRGLYKLTLKAVKFSPNLCDKLDNIHYGIGFEG